MGLPFSPFPCEILSSSLLVREGTRARRGVRVENRAGYLELLLRADATATTTMHIFTRPAVSRGMHLSVTVSIGRKVMAVGQAIKLTIYTTRSLKRDETAGYIRLVRAAGEGDPDTVMRDAEDAGLEGDRSPMESDTYVRYPIDDFSD